MKRFFLGLILVGLSLRTFAQALSLESATEGKWSGGIVGRSGVDYKIAIKVKGKVSFDSIYINNKGYAISPAGPSRGNLWIDTAKHIYTIGISELHNSRPDPVNSNQQLEQEYKGPMRKFNGEALIVYNYKKKKHLFLVREMKELPPKMYP